MGPCERARRLGIGGGGQGFGVARARCRHVGRVNVLGFAVAGREGMREAWKTTRSRFVPARELLRLARVSNAATAQACVSDVRAAFAYVVGA